MIDGSKGITMYDNHSSTRQMRLRVMDPNPRAARDIRAMRFNEILENPSLERVLDAVCLVTKSPHGGLASLEISGGRFNLRGNYTLDVYRPISEMEHEYMLNCDLEFPWLTSHHVCLNTSLSTEHYVSAFTSFYRGDEFWYSDLAWEPAIPVSPAHPAACLESRVLENIDDPSLAQSTYQLGPLNRLIQGGRRSLSFIDRRADPSPEQVVAAVRELPKDSTPSLLLFIFDTVGSHNLEVLIATRITNVDFRLHHIQIAVPNPEDPNTDPVLILPGHTSLPHNANAIIRVLISFLKRDNAWITSVPWDPPFELARSTGIGSSPGTDDQAPSVGVVYLLRAGSWYKIGKSTDPTTRYQQLAIQLPEKPELVHEIHTNHIHRLERHWHRFFSDRRANGEWFQLMQADIAEFLSYDHVQFKQDGTQ